ncbi:MAG: hypothetical protein QXY05_03285 [Candidatus Anstonellales archaeon]
MKAFRLAFDDMKQHADLVWIFSLSALIGVLMFAMAQYPTYSALGGVFLRTGSLPDVGIVDFLITIVVYGISLLLISSAVAGTMLIIAHRRTKKVIKTELWKKLPFFATNTFFLYAFLTLVLLAMQVFSIPYYSVLAFALFYLTFYIVPAMIVENESIGIAIFPALRMLKKNPLTPIVWAVFGFVILGMVELVAQSILPYEIARYVVLFFNGVLLLPYLSFVQAHMYMERYPLAG